MKKVHMTGDFLSGKRITDRLKELGYPDYAREAILKHIAEDVNLHFWGKAVWNPDTAELTGELNEERYSEEDDIESLIDDEFWKYDKPFEVAVLMEDRCTKSEAERYLRDGTTVYENPQEWIDELKACGCYEGQSLEVARSGKYGDVQMVTYEGHEYLIEYAN